MTKAPARSTGLEPVTSGVTVDEEARLLPSPSWQTFATTESRLAKEKGSGRGGRVRTAPRVPPVSPNRDQTPLTVARLQAVLLVADVAAELRVSRATVYKLCDEGRMPHFRVAGAIRIRREEFGAYLVKLDVANLGTGGLMGLRRGTPPTTS
jgi:excisionase family DNA binding protein